jgi:hypothetical protein
MGGGVFVMAIESALKSAVNLKLNAGTRPGTGGMIVKTVALRGVTYQADAGKIMSVGGALVPVLEHPLYRVERQETTVLEN